MKNYIRIPEPQSPAEMDALSRDDMSRLIAQRNESSSRATLVESLIIMGEFEEALVITKDEEKKKWINKLIKAEARDDDHRCQCTAHLDVQDYTRFGEDASPKLEQTPHYIRTYRHWSSKYNAMVYFYQCSVCGCIQSLPDDQDIDELHAKQYEIKNQALDSAIKLGIPFRRL